MAKKVSDPSDELPKIPGWIQNGFHRFLTPYLKRHFQAVAVTSESLRSVHLIGESDSVIVYANHPSWWDPLIAHFLNQTFFADRQFWAPIDADALDQYEVLKKLGFFGINADTKSGAATFLRMSGRILNDVDASGHKTAALWITPEGRFTDPRDHSGELMPGLAHLCHKMPSGVALPLAMEYVFWDERLPLCLIRLGDPIGLADATLQSKEAWTERLVKSLRDAQDELSELAMDRRREPFENLLVGKPGAGGVYDFLRRTKSLLTGKRFKASHGDQFG